MAQPQSTSVLIRVQARGGKFLGPAVQYAQISVLNGSEVLVPPVVATGDSGIVDTNSGAPFPMTASRDVIVAQASSGGPPQGAYWLTSDAGTAGIVATFMLAEPALLEFRATALYDTPSPVTTSSMMWVIPGMQLTSEPGVLLSIPGLHVTAAATAGEQLDVTATVTMMCGCPITTPTWPEPSGGPEPFWPCTEFSVVATLTPPDGVQVTQTMDFAETNTFTTSFALPASGTSTVEVYALQQAESNVGYARTAVEIGG